MQYKISLSTLALLAASSPALGQVSGQQMVSNIDAITTQSSNLNTVAQSISVTNFFSTAPQLVNGFKEIITTAQDDITSMGSSSKRTVRRQDALNQPLPATVGDLLEILSDPAEILGSKKTRRQDALDQPLPDTVSDLLEILQNPAQVLGSKKRSQKTRRQSSSYTDTEQEAICNAFTGFVRVHQQLLSTVIGKHGLLSLTPFTQPIAAVLRTLEGVVDSLAFGIIDSVPTCAQSSTDQKNNLDSTLADAVNEYSN